MHLSPDEAIHNIDGIDVEEKSKITEWIALVAVIDERRDYLAAGYSCMLNFCMGRLHMSKDEALRRIQIAKAALRFPQVFECLADGRLGVTTAAVLAPHLEPGRRRTSWSRQHSSPSTRSCGWWQNGRAHSRRPKPSLQASYLSRQRHASMRQRIRFRT